MSWRKKVNPGKEKKKRDARKKEFALVLARIRDNDPGLKAASLRQLGLVEADAEELYDALKGNTVLRSLDISRNHLRDGGAVYLAKIIRESQSLVTLNACFNEFSPLVVARFGPAVRRNVFLTKLLLEEKATIPGTNQKLLHSCPIVATARLRLELFIGENLCFERAICGSTTTLELKNRRLEEIPTVLFSLRHLVKLNLGSNRLCRIPEAIGQLRSLEKLILSDNAIIAVDEEIASLPKLAVLDLSNNLLLAVSCSIANLPCLATLHLDGNLLHERWQLPCEELTRRLCDPSDSLSFVAAPFVQCSPSPPVTEQKRDLTVAFAAAGEADATLSALQVLQKLCICREPGVPKKKLSIVKRALDQFSLEELQISVPRNLVGGRGAAAARRLSYKVAKGGAAQRLNISFYDAFASGMVLSRTSLVTHEVVMVWLRDPLAQLQEFVSETMLGLGNQASKRQFIILVGVLQTKADLKSILAEDHSWKTPQHKMAAIAQMAPFACTPAVVSLATGAGLNNLMEKLAQCPVSSLAADEGTDVMYRRAVERLRSMALTKRLSTEKELAEDLACLGLVKSGDQRRVLEHARRLAILGCLSSRGEDNIYVHGLGHMPSVVRDLVEAAQLIHLPGGFAPCVPEKTLRALLTAQWGLDEAVDRAVALLRQSGITCHLDGGQCSPGDRQVLVLPALPPGRQMDLQLEGGHIRVFKFTGHPGHAFAKLIGILLMDLPTDIALGVNSVFANRVVMSGNSGSTVTVSLHVKQKSIFVSCVHGCDKEALLFVMRSFESVLETFRGDAAGLDIICPHCTAGKLLSTVVQEFGAGKISYFPLSDLEESIARGQPYICRVYKDWPVAVQMELYMPDVALEMSGSMAMDHSRLKMGKKIGEGGFADVFVAQLEEDPANALDGAQSSQTVAVKVLRVVDDAGTNFSAFRKEVTTMLHLQHPQLVVMLGYTMDPPCIVSEYCPEGDLHEYLALRAEAKAPLPANFVLRVMFDLAKGLSFLHTSFPPMIHRDLKPANVLLLSRVGDIADGGSGDIVANTNEVVAKITDFGLMVQSTLPIESRRVLTPYWLAPEILHSKPYSCASDMFAFGIIAIQCLTLRLPYEELNLQFNSELEEAICSGARPAVSEDDLARLPLPVRSALLQTLKEDPAERPTASEMASLLQLFVGEEADDDDLLSMVEACVDEYVAEMEELSDNEGDMLFSAEGEDEDDSSVV